VKIPALEKAAKRVAKIIKQHMKKDGWDLDYSAQVTEVFYEAFGHHLENYLITELCKWRQPLALGMKGNKVVLTKKIKKSDLKLNLFRKKKKK
jgi:hypothetical protein